MVDLVFMNRILITGAEGFIGTNFINYLLTSCQLNSDFEITVLNRPSSKFSSLDHLILLNPGFRRKIKRVSGLIEDALLVNNLVARSDTVINLAANTGVQKSLSSPLLDANSNVIGVINILEACRHSSVQRVILISSGAPTGCSEPPVSEVSPTNPLSPYGCSKLAGESYAGAYFECFNVPVITLRFSNIYGPFCMHKTSVVSKFIKQAMNNSRLTIHGSLENCRDFLYVDDVSTALVASIQAPDTALGKVFQLGTGIPTSLLTLINTLNSILASRQMNPLEYKIGPSLPGDIPRTWTDPSRAKHLLGWQASASFPESISLTLDYLLSTQDLQSQS